MAAYPATFISRTSGIEPDAGIRADAADDGTIMFRKLRAGTAYAITIVHEWITQAQYDSLLDFLVAEGFGPHTLTLKGHNYSITLLNEPAPVDQRGHLYMVTAKALAVRT